MIRLLFIAYAALVTLGGETPVLRKAQASPVQAQQLSAAEQDPFAYEPTEYEPLGYDPFNDDLHADHRSLTKTPTSSQDALDASQTTQAQEIASTTQKPSQQRPQASQGTKSLAGSSSTLAQGIIFPDIQSSWAQPFIEVLANRGIIAGFPDGTFRPDVPVTRAQYAAIIQQAFNQATVRPGSSFVDVPASFWAEEAIDYAYRSGFLAGYPNQVFRPDQNIPRVQALVSLSSGLNLPTAPTLDLSAIYNDAGQIPDYALDGIRAATNEQLVVNYPNVSLLNPNQLATRADVAAFIYQALVEAGQLPPLAPSVAATDYIVGYETEIAEQPSQPLSVEEARERLRVPEPALEEILVISRDDGVPSFGVSVPSGFGADSGEVFVGVGYQADTRPLPPDGRQVEDGGFIVGFGLGDAVESVGLQVGVSSFSLFRDDTVPFETGGLSLKLHRQIDNATSVAVGVENVVDWGNSDGFTSYYGAATRIFTLSQDPKDLFSSIAVTLGVGDGRFRTFEDIEDDDDTINVFGSVGVRVAEPVSIVGAYTGQTISLGVSVAPFRDIPLVITPAVTDLINVDNDPRFTITAGYVFRLF